MPLTTFTPTRAPQLSLRLKLTLWMVLLFLVVQLSLVVVYQFYQRRSINIFFDERLISRQQQIAEEIKPALPAITDAALQAIAQNYRKMLFQRAFVVEVFDEHGRSVASSQLPRTEIPPALWESVRHASQPVSIKMPASFLRSDAATQARTIAGWTVAPDGRPFLVMVSWDDFYAVDMTRLLFGVVFVSIPIGVIAVAVSAYAISGVAVQPIRAMRQMAKGLEPERLSEQLMTGGAGAELELLRRDLDQTRIRLETAFAAQERFMSNVSHELKTPIAVLLTEAQTLRPDRLSPDARAFVASTTDELEKLGRMVDSFLLLTRVRHGKATVPNQELCRARDIMVQSYEGCVPMALQYGVRLTIRLPDGDDLDAGVHGNCDLLRTVLDNLIRNAIRFSPKGDTVELDGAVDGDRLLIRVRDMGSGIPADVLPRIFDRFAQAPEEQRRGRGHGLGLEIAMGITELHGGIITAANRPGRGCEFTVSLPLARPSDKSA